MLLADALRRGLHPPVSVESSPGRSWEHELAAFRVQESLFGFRFRAVH
jgi:hypothetical protein